MFGKRYISKLINHSTNDPDERRRFLKTATAAGLGLGLVGTGVVGAAVKPTPASAAEAAPPISDDTIFNFVLNQEYLEAEFYSYAVTGEGLPTSLTTGTGQSGPVIGGAAVPFKSSALRQFAAQIARDEHEHVAYFRSILGSSAATRPTINLQDSFTAVAVAAGLIRPGGTFNPFASEDDFLRGAFIFEDVGVTGLKGAAPLINNKSYLSAAAGILAVEAYHAANIRTELYERGGAADANAISAARNSLNPGANLDQGITVNGQANIIPDDSNGIIFGRTPGQVLNIVYLTPNQATQGGFYPSGVNSSLNTSA